VGKEPQGGERGASELQRGQVGPLRTVAAQQDPFGSSGFKTGAAKSHQNLAKSKLDHAILTSAGFETGATTGRVL
jgi:hypothetical protein